MPNNHPMNMTPQEIIHLLGGITEVARMLEIKPPSVYDWLKSGIPDGRMVQLAGQIEIKSKGRFSRRDHWPEKYDFYWPELVTDHTNQPQQATGKVAN